MKIRRAKVALIGFVAFLGTIIVLADSGHGRSLFALADRLPAGDKLGHFILFGILSFLVNLILRAAEWRWNSLTLLKGSAIVFSLSAVEEFTQLFFRARTFDLLDLLAGGLGVWLCGRLAQAYLRWKRSRRTKPAVLGSAAG